MCGFYICWLFGVLIFELLWSYTVMCHPSIRYLQAFGMIFTWCNSIRCLRKFNDKKLTGIRIEITLIGERIMQENGISGYDTCFCYMWAHSAVGKGSGWYYHINIYYSESSNVKMRVIYRCFSSVALYRTKSSCSLLRLNIRRSEWHRYNPLSVIMNTVIEGKFTGSLISPPICSALIPF